MTLSRHTRRLILPNPTHSARAWGWLINRAPDTYFERLLDARAFLARCRAADIDRFFEEQFKVGPDHPHAEDLS